MDEVKATISKPGAVLKVSGEDAAEFLQSQCTQDLGGGIGQCRYGLWLDHRGQVHGDSFVLQAEEETFYLISYFTPGLTLADKLHDHIIADDVEIEDLTESHELCTILGDWRGLPLPDSVRELAYEGKFVSDRKRFYFTGRRGATALEILHPLGKQVIEESWPVKRIGAEDLERLRIQNKIPAIPVDIGPAETPLAGHLEKDAVSFEKGCYLGQEVVARMHRLGRTPVEMVFLESESSEDPGDQSALYAGGKAAGTLRSSIRDGSRTIGLGIIKSKLLDQYQKVELGQGGIPFEITRI